MVSLNILNIYLHILAITSSKAHLAPSGYNKAAVARTGVIVRKIASRSNGLAIIFNDKPYLGRLF